MIRDYNEWPMSKAVDTVTAAQRGKLSHRRLRRTAPTASARPYYTPLIRYSHLNINIHFLCTVTGIIEASLGSAARSVTVKPTGCGFDPHWRRWNIYLNLYFHFFALVSRLSAVLSSATQHAMPPELGTKWGTECLNIRFPPLTLLWAGYSVKLIRFNSLESYDKQDIRCTLCFWWDYQLQHISICRQIITKKNRNVILR